MQFLILVIDNRSPSGTSDEMEAIMAFNTQLREDGHWVFAGGLSAPSNAKVIDNRNGVAISSNGPLYETKEFYSGFWIINAADIETAERIALGGSRACNRRVELRPFLD